MIIDKLKDNDILILNPSQKQKVIEECSSKSLLNIKFMTLNDLKENFYFKYDEKAHLYLMKKYDFAYDVANKYLNNLYYLYFASDINDPKIIHLKKLKKELDSAKLLYYTPLFKDFLQHKNIIIYNNKYLSKFYQNLIEEIKKETKANILMYSNTKEEYHHNKIYKLNSLEDEIVFVATSICKLVIEGIDINNIKICGINSEYNIAISRIFKMFNIPITFNTSKLYATKIAKDFLSHLDDDITITLSFIEENYNLEDEHILDIYNKIINILNKYTWCNSYLEIKPLLINDFKNQIINKENLSSKVEILDNLSDASQNNYVFLMNFNQGQIPQTIKDEDYLSDSLKSKLNLDTSNDINNQNQAKWLDDIKHTKNLIITYKTHSLTGDYYLSSLNDILKLEQEIPQKEYNYSNIYNKIELTDKIDNLIKYNTYSKELEVLFNNYNDIEYMTYNNKYTKIDPRTLKRYLKNNLNLSYSAINNYYHCSFKYYLSNILNINIYEETFMTILGNLFHYILSICFDKDIDIDATYQRYIDKQEYKFNAKELFFLNNLKEELKFIIETIKEQYSYSSLNKSLYESRVEIDKSINDMKIIFKGFIDKIMLDNDEQMAAIIDYKTGSTQFNLNNTIHGLDLQLPTYIYLLKNKFPSIRIVGFYLQKIINPIPSSNPKVDYLKQKQDNLKLQGYTNIDESLIEMLDSNYQNSKVIQGMSTTSSGFRTKKVLSDDEIDKLYQITESKIDNAIHEITNANFTINPKRIGMNNIGCQFCTYKDICFMSEKDIINLKEYKKMEFLKKE